MADQNDISQFVAEVAADAADTQISQFVIEVAADAGLAQISQAILEAAAAASGVQISQLTIELARGPEVVPPADSPTEVFTFDAGLGNEYFIALQPSDSGIENRDKVVKSVRVTAQIHNGFVKVYAYGPVENVDVDQIVQGLGQKTAVVLADCSQVQQSKRHPVNIPRAMMHLVRVEGRWDGTGERDRIDEIYYEISQQGPRR